MKIAIRADSSSAIGTGHIMRCLTLSEELLARGHEVVLFSSEITVNWLLEKVKKSGIQIVQVPLDSCDFRVLESFSPDLVIVDSYRIESNYISELSTHIRVLSIVDLDTRGINSDMYLDQNFNSEKQIWPTSSDATVLAGSKYALIRNEVLAELRESPWNFTSEIPKVLCVMGGSDPTGTIVQISAALQAVQTPFEASLIVSEEWLPQVSEIVQGNPAISLHRPTPDLASQYGNADIVISAAGSSAWELCTLGIPSLLIAVADNQQLPMREISKAKLALTIDKDELTNSELVDAIVANLKALMNDSDLRKTLSTNSLSHFDGLGKQRVADAIEDLILRGNA